MTFSWLDFFTHPVLMAPTLGTILMSIFASIMGVFIYVKKRSLLAECLSHAAYPGILLGLFFFDFHLLGGVVFALLGYQLLKWLEGKNRLHPDTALCVVLASFLGFGVLLSSIFQRIAPTIYKQSLIYLYGQAATMVQHHIVWFSLFSLTSIIFVLLFFSRLKALTFDPLFIQSIGLKEEWLERALFFLITLSIVIGTRATGIILMTGMMIAPPLFARALTDRLSTMIFLSATIGALSAFIGNVLSVNLPLLYFEGVSLPTGPLILITASVFTLIAFLFAPKKGYFIRLIRLQRFRFRCRKENALKSLWKGLEIGQVDRYILRVGGEAKGGKLTEKGKKKANYIIRLHRLWELYLSKELGITGSRVHESAEEMEHILTPEIERMLTQELANPTTDPHKMEIPRREG